MKALQYAGLGAAAVLALVIIVSFFLPATATLSRSIEINAPVSVVYAQVADLKTWELWDPWSGRDTTMTMTYDNEQTAGVGAVRRWLSEDPNVGSGSMTIVAAEENDSLSIALDMGYGVSSGNWKFQESAGITKATWTYYGETTTPPVAGKYFGLALETWLAPDYEAGLASLKALAESLPVEPEVPEFQVDEIAMKGPQWAIGMLSECAPDGISQTLGVSYQAILAYMGENGLEMAGAPLCRYQTYFNTKGNVELEAGAPIADSVAISDDRFHLMRLGGGTVAKTTHVGHYTKLGSTHKAMAQWLNENNKVQDGHAWESFVTDPGQEPNSALWKTDIYYPLAE